MPEDKKTAAQNPSAPTDGGQLSYLNKNSIAENPVQDNPYMEKSAKDPDDFFQQLQDPDFLRTVSMEQLFESVYPGKPAIIEDFLYTGVYLFAGAPKVGKSFFMGQLAYHVSKGLPLDGRKVHQGAVLYLALEDTYGNVTIPFVDRFPKGEIYNLLTTRPEDVKNEAKTE